MAHNEHEEFEDGFGPEDIEEEGHHDEESYGDEDDEEGHHEHGDHEDDEEGEESEYPEDEEEEEEYGEEEPTKSDDAKSNLKKYAPYGIGAALLAGVAYLFFGHSSQHVQAPQPQNRPALHSSTAMTPQQPNSFQTQANHPVTVANNGSLTSPNGPAPSFGNGQNSAPTPQYPTPLPRANNRFGNGNGFNRPIPMPPSEDGSGDSGFQGPPNENISPEQRMSIENRANGSVFRAIAAMQKSLHEDIHKTSDDEKTAIIKRLDDMQKELEQKLKSDDSSGASNTQISGIRDMVSALKQSLDNANESIKSQQDTITSLRTELNAMKQKEADEQAQIAAKEAEEAAKHSKGSKKSQKHQSQSQASAPVAHEKSNNWGPSDWKLRGYNSAKNVAIIQSPNNEYFEESIGYEARDDHNRPLSGVGKLKGVEKLPSGVYVLHTSLGEIMEGN